MHMGHPQKYEPFWSLLPPLTEQEQQELENEITDDARIREPLVIWHNKLVDGYHRLELAKKLGYEYQVRVLDEGWTEQQVIDWILRHQLARRNLSPELYALTYGRLYNAEKSKNLGKLRVGQNVLPETGDTAEKLAEEAKTTSRTIRRWGNRAEIIDSFPPAIKRHATQLTDGELKKLAACDRLVEINNALRMTRAPDIPTAWQQVVGKPFSGKKPPDPIKDVELDDSIRSKVRKAIEQEEITAEDAEALAQYEPESQAELVESVLDGRQTWEQAIATGEIPEPSIEQICKDATSAIESFCRHMLTEWKDKVPNDEWIKHRGRGETALQGLKSCLATIRACKTVPCPECEGAGCKLCFDTGRVDNETYRQLANV